MNMAIVNTLLFLLSAIVASVHSKLYNLMSCLACFNASVCALFVKVHHEVCMYRKVSSVKIVNHVNILDNALTSKVVSAVPKTVLMIVLP